MKTRIIILLLSVVSFSVKAQIIPIEQWGENNNMYNINNVYFKDVNGLLNKYVGTWEYNQNGHYFKIRFIKQPNYQEVPLNSPSKTKWTSDRIYALFQYKLNGVEIYNTFTTQNSSFIYSSSGSFLGGYFWVFYDEPSVNTCGRPLMGEVALVYSNVNGVEQLTWNRTEKWSGTFCPQGQTADNTPFQIPADMILTKVPATLD